MNNKSRYGIDVSDALPTKNYWVLFIVWTLIATLSAFGNAQGVVISLKDTANELSESQAQGYYFRVVCDSIITNGISCALGIILNVLLRYKRWRWIYLLLYITTSIAFFTCATSIIAGEVRGNSPGIFWFIFVALYRWSYVKEQFGAVSKTSITVSSSAQPQTNFTPNINTHSTQEAVFCTKCGRKMQFGDNFCKGCGTAVDVPKTTPSSTPQNTHICCPVCGVYYIAAPVCSYCGAKNENYVTTKIAIPQNAKLEIRDVKTNDAPPPLIEGFSPYYDAYKTLLDKISPRTIAEAANNYESKPRKRVEFECKCFMAFMHHLATREDEYSEINSMSYMAKLLIHISGKEAFNGRISDYLEIDLSGKTLPHINLLLNKLDPSVREQADNCNALNYIYAFTVFSKNAKNYVAHRDFKDIENLLEATGVNFFEEETVQIFEAALITYNNIVNLE